MENNDSVLLSEVVSEEWLSLPFNKCQQEFSAIGLNSIVPGHGDPIAKWLVGGGVGRRILQIFIVLVWAAVPAFVAYLEGNFRNGNLSPDVLQDAGYWNQYALALPVGILLIAMYFGRLPSVIAELASSSTFEVTVGEWNLYCKQANQILGARWVRWGTYSVSIVVMVFLAFAWIFATQGKWLSIRDGNFAGLFQLPQYFFLYYVICFTTFEIVASYLVLRGFFKFKSNIQPLHPDGRGGLAPLGKLSMQLNLAVFLFGVISGIGLYTTVFVHNEPALSHMNVIIVVSYLIGASTLFFLPPYAASRHMRNSKMAALHRINDRFSKLNEKFLESLGMDQELDDSLVEDMGSLKGAYEMINRMPVLPFNIRSIGSFIGSILGAPLFLAVLQPFIETVASLILRSSS
ncbi:MAG: hypothetical protein CMO55_05265 [Verrucomicrobiales bacterium]|nr:hypothetical protein [Verrucomicrobiales bacterium]